MPELVLFSMSDNANSVVPMNPPEESSPVRERVPPQVKTARGDAHVEGVFEQYVFRVSDGDRADFEEHEPALHDEHQGGRPEEEKDVEVDFSRF